MDNPSRDIQQIRYPIDVWSADLDNRQEIESQKYGLIRQGEVLTNEHIIQHQITDCTSVVYNLKIKILNNLIRTINEILCQTNLPNERMESCINRFTLPESIRELNARIQEIEIYSDYEPEYLFLQEIKNEIDRKEYQSIDQINEEFISYAINKAIEQLSNGESSNTNN